jgi:protein O-mannosyl-transferase
MSTNTQPFWSPPRLRVALTLALAAVAVAVFWPATGYDFLNFDDDVYVSNNLLVQQGLTWHGIRWAFTSVYELWWLPLLWISYMVDIELFGLGAYGHHLVNILLHALNVALLFWALARMTKSSWPAAFAAALFALHPQRLESVAWITERKDVLSGVFFFLCLIAHLRQVEHPSPLRFWTLQFLMLLGLMAKSMLIILPFILLLLDYWPLRRAGDPWGPGAWSRWRPLLAEKSILFALSAVFIVVTIVTHGTTGEHVAATSWWTRATLVAPNYWSYLGKIAWPADLSLIYPPGMPSVLARILAPLGLLALTGLFLRWRAKHPALLIGWLWFLVALGPVIRGLRFDEQSAYSDRYTYLSAIGLGIALAWTAAEALARWRHRRAILSAAAVLVLAACTAQTRAMLPLWKDSLTAFGNILRHAPDHVLANTNIGEHLLNAGRPDLALPHLEIAAAGSTRDLLPHSNLGMALLLLHRPGDAIQRMEAARQRLQLDSDLLSFVTGLAWMEQNQPETAIPFFLRAMDTPRPPPPTWRAELARAYRDAGQMQAYSNELARIADAGFLNLASYEGLGLYYMGLWQRGHGRRSWTFFQRELEREPDNVPMLNNTAWFLATLPPAGASPEDAIRLALQAKETSRFLQPDVLDTLAVAYAANGQFDEAIRTAEEAKALALSKGNRPLAQRIDERLQAYRAGMAWGASGPVAR